MQLLLMIDLVFPLWFLFSETVGGDCGSDLCIEGVYSGVEDKP
ncbi:hypothetical protein HanPI659440_Chr04g0155991 [Helianthus annuus]|nr:hypothetical protein HanPI659440_Chr04g0155991 [Helianthus annuus]